LVVALRRRRSGADQIPAEVAVAAEHPLLSAERRHRIAELFRPKEQEDVDALSRRVAQAGLQDRDAVDLYLTVRVFLLVVAVLLGFGIYFFIDSRPAAVLLAAATLGLAFVGPSLWLGHRVTVRQQQVGAALPYVLDMLVTCLDAGLGLEQALERVAGRVGNEEDEDDVLTVELRTTLGEIKAGIPSGVAFRKLAARVGLEDVNTLAVVITHATSMGTNIANILRDHARSMRQHRLLQLEEKAGKANAKLTLPLALCLLPSVLVLLLGPAVLMILRSF
jgi:tight adherence protein C